MKEYVDVELVGMKHIWETLGKQSISNDEEMAFREARKFNLRKAKSSLFATIEVFAVQDSLKIDFANIDTTKEEERKFRKTISHSPFKEHK